MRLFLISAFSGLLLFAQDDAVFRSQSSLAALRFHVIQKDRYVVTLKPEDVTLLEDGAPRKFTVFDIAQSAATTTPVEMTLLFDTSGSVMDKGLLNPLAFRESLLESLPNVKIAVYGFSTGMTRYSGPTRDFKQLETAFASLGVRGAGQPIELQLPPKRKAEKGGTWLYEAVRAVSREASATPGEAARIVMVFSDGLPTTTSRPEDAADLDRELGIPVYPLILGHGDLVRRLEEARSRVKPVKVSKKGAVSGGSGEKKVEELESRLSEVGQFSRLGELTGGRFFDPPVIALEVMKQVLGAMVDEVRTEYTIGFPIEPSDNPKKHRLEVKLVNKELGKVRGGTRTLVH
jgi:VWFA-related protein